MSEFSLYYRIHGVSKEELWGVLGEQFPDYTRESESLIPSPERIAQLKAAAVAGHKAMGLSGAPFEYDDRYYWIPLYSSPTAPGSVAFSTWLTSESVDLTEVFSARGWTFLTYGYHTGAGWDELHIVQHGKRRYVANAAEQYIEVDGEGHEIALGVGSIQERALSALWEELGDARVLIEGWQDCVKDSRFLSTTLPDL